MRRNLVFRSCQQKNVDKAKAAPQGAGDCWTWTALDAENKLIISFLVGGRDAEYANEFMPDVAARLANRVQLTTDGHKAYLEAVEDAFGADIDYAQLVKLYGRTPVLRPLQPRRMHWDQEDPYRRSPRQGSCQHVLRGAQNLKFRMGMRRFTRLTNAFSKKVEPHYAMVCLYTVFHNYVHIHKTLKCTPAMAAGLTTKLWSMADLVAMIDAQAKPPKRPRMYKIRSNVEPA